MAIATFAVTFAVGIGVTKLVPSVNASLPRSTKQLSYQPAFELKAGRQIALVYIGKASCAWSNREGVPEAVESVKLSLSRYAGERNASFNVIGIALDWSPEKGMTHLAKFGRFDEIAAGANWSNTLVGALQDFAGGISTPTLLVIERTVDLGNGDAFTGFREIRNQRLLAKKVGVFEISTWAKNGAVLPSS